MPLPLDQQIGLQALLTCRTKEAAARKAKIDRATLYRWLQEAEFSAAYSDACNKMQEATLAGLQAKHGRATDTLDKSLNSKSEVIRVRAAAVLMDAGFRAAEFSGLVKEIRELRALVYEYRKSAEAGSRNPSQPDAGNGRTELLDGNSERILPIQAG